MAGVNEAPDMLQQARLLPHQSAGRSFNREDAELAVRYSTRRHRFRLLKSRCLGASLFVVALVAVTQFVLRYHEIAISLQASHMQAQGLLTCLLAVVLVLHGDSTARAAFAPPLFDNGNRILYNDLDPNIFERLGQYAPRYTVQNDPPFAPVGCVVEVVDSLERHGARLQTSGGLLKAQTTLSKIQNAIKSSGTGVKLPPELAFFPNASLLRDTSSLVPYGALQAYYSGRTTASVYPQLSYVPPFVRASGDEATQNDRVILTAKYWRLGFTGGKFPSGNVATQADVRQAAAGLPKPDVIFSELPGQNNTLDVSTCTADNNRPSSQGESAAQQAYANNNLVQTVGKELQARFASAGVKGLNLTATDLINLATTCSFETLGRASVNNGQLGKVQQSPFCGVFNATEWPSIGYVFDVGKYYGGGYGDPYHNAVGTGFLRELVARFTGNPPPLSQSTSLNSTIDGNSRQFPLTAPLKGPFVYFDGSHDNNIAPIVSAANLFNGPVLGTGVGAENAPHNWVFGKIAPLQGKVVFEKLKCAGRNSAQSPSSVYGAFVDDFVRVRANGAVLDAAQWCSAGNAGDGLCSMAQFLTQTAFVEQANEWNKCFS